MRLNTNIKTLILLAPIGVFAAGCTIGRKQTAGEEIVQSAREAPPATEPASKPTTIAIATMPAPVTRATAIAATTPATNAASTAPADRGPRIHVSADADDATVLRNWPVSVNYIPSGHAIAGPTYRIIAPPPRSDHWTDTYAVDLFQTFLSIPQIVATPVWAIVTPPWTPVEYHGETYPPTYTLDDPLPYYETERVPGMLQMKRDK